MGVRQAETIGKRLAAEVGGEGYAMYSSDLLRAKRTAQIVGGFLGIQPIFYDALREMNLGEAVGKSKEWARENAVCPLWPGTIDWPASIDDMPFAGAESKRDVWNRLWGFLQQALNDNAQENIILVSHDGTLSLFFAMWLGLEIEMLHSRGLQGKAGGVSVLRQDLAGNRMIGRLNDMSYIG